MQILDILYIIQYEPAQYEFNHNGKDNECGWELEIATNLTLVWKLWKIAPS